MANFKKKFKEEHYNGVKLFPHIKSLIPRLKKQGFDLGIVSATSEALIRKFLSKFKLDNYFDFILSSSGTSKISLLRQIIRLNGYKIDKSYFVTDTFNDLCYGKKIGIKTVAVLWGFHKKDLLLKCKPDFIIKKYEEIFSIIKN